MKKVIALASADWHINNWQEVHSLQDGLSRSLQPMVEIGNRAAKLNIPILFAGDLFHKPKGLDNIVLEQFIDKFRKHIFTPFVSIAGNHDQSEKNTNKHISPNYINSFSKILPNMDYIGGTSMYGYYNPDTYMVYGIDYYKHNIGFKNRLKDLSNLPKTNGLNILLIHTDLPGAVNGYNHIIDSAEGIDGDLDKYFKAFDLVLCGHIHKPQRLSKNVYMLGSPGHQNKGDMGIGMGYWEVYSDASMKFVHLDMPEYKYYEGKEKPDNRHIWIPKPKKIKTAEKSIGNFDNKSNKVALAKNYLNEKKIKDKTKRIALIKALKKL